MERYKTILLTMSTALSLLTLTRLFKSNISIHDVSKTWSIEIVALKHPTTIDQLRSFVQKTDTPISIAGGRYSQGGQIAYPGAIVIDITLLNNIKSLDIKNKLITVEAGTTWRDIQNYIDPYNLSVSIMQSYNDFTIGGSLSVNVHGRMRGSLIKSAVSITIMLADGSLKTVSRNHDPELFNAVIGGYGLLGIIIEATLQLTDNIKIERITHRINLSKNNYKQFFFQSINEDEEIIIHNTDLYPNEFTIADSIAWRVTNKKVTIKNRLQMMHNLYPKERLQEQLLSRIPLAKISRPFLENIKLQTNRVVWRNYEMSYTVKSLEPLIRYPTTTILQEYFIPIDQLETFLIDFKKIIKLYGVNIINLSIRHVMADTESLLAYAPQESFALVLYINIFNTHIGHKKTERWTQKLIDQALAMGGTYYLPYALYATQEQFERAYPNFLDFLQLKKQYDPTNKFVNMLYKKYMEESYSG